MPLFKLILLQGRSVRRRMLRGAKSVRGAAFLLLGTIIFSLWLGPSLWLASTTARTDPQIVKNVVPVFLLMICLMNLVTSAGEKAIAFSPAEVDFLFPAPFTRRQLLAYKIGKSAAAAMFASLILSLVLLKHAQMWIACYVGVILTLLFTQFFSTIVMLAIQSVAERAHSRARKLVLGVAAAVLVVGLMQARGASVDAKPLDIVNHLRQSPVIRAVLTPFGVFGNTLTAPHIYPDLLKWGGVALCVDAAMLWIIFSLDTNFMEAGIAAGQRHYDRVRRMRRGGLTAISSKSTIRWHLPPFPWAGGAGPIAWRQITAALRGSRGLLLVLLFGGLVVGPGVLLGRSHRDATGPIVTGLAWLTVFLSSTLKFDFRGDVDQMENLKALPIRPAAVALGQLAAPTLLMTVVHAVLLVTAAILSPASRHYLIAAVFLSLPLNGLLFSVENLTFLLFPSRMATASPGDLQNFGRQAVLFFLKIVILIAAAGIATVCAGALWMMIGFKLIPLAIVAWIVLMLEVAALIPAMAFAFMRYDPSANTPT